VPLRIAADYHLSGDKRALKVLRRFAGFFDSEFVLRGRILAEYACDGSVSNPYENPLFSSAAYAALDASGAPAAPAVLERFRRFIRQDENGCWYEDPKDYYVNSIAWLVEYYRLQQQ
jgi:endoglucanase